MTSPQPTDERPLREYFDYQNRPTPTEVRHTSQKGWTTFILVGDGTTNVYASCPKAPEKNYKCASYSANAIKDGATAAEVEEHAFQEAKALTKFIAGLEGYEYPGPAATTTTADSTPATASTLVTVPGAGCPVHDAPPAVPTVEDQAALALSPERVNQAITEAITELASGA